MKIYKFGPDFYAAKNLRDAVREYCSCSGDSIREGLENFELLTETEMDEYTFFDDVYNQDDENPNTSRSFKEQLEAMIHAGDKFPTAFASSEY